MPTYDYECDACEHKFEVFEAMSADPQTKCPECKKKKLRRLFGAGAAVVFKGSGFYTTDYRSDSYKKAADADKKPSDGGGAASDTKSSGSKTSDSKSSEGKSTESKSSESKPADKPSPPKSDGGSKGKRGKDS